MLCFSFFTCYTKYKQEILDYVQNEGIFSVFDQAPDSSKNLLYCYCRLETASDQSQ
jgi:hypothetical protein